MKNMKGQAAMEYLMTYGWALIILVVVIGVLFSMGVFNPQNYMSEECSFQPSLPCKGATLTKSGTLKVYMTNGLGYKVESWAMEVNGKKASEAVNTKDGTIIFEINNLGTYTSHDIEKFKPTITYAVGDEMYTISGTLTVRVSE